MCGSIVKSNHTSCGATTCAPSSRFAVNKVFFADTALAVSVLFILLGVLMLKDVLHAGIIITVLRTLKLTNKQTGSTKL